MYMMKMNIGKYSVLEINMELRNLLIAAVLSVFIGAISTWGIMSHNHNTALKQEAKMYRAACEAKLCGGEDFGQVRINLVKCAGETELCICGDPSMINEGI